VILAMTRHPTVRIIQIRNRNPLRKLPHLQKKIATEHLFDHGGAIEVIDQMTVIVVKDDDLKTTDGTVRLIPLTRVVKRNVADDHDDCPVD
jgi:hypothetical protein